MIVKKTVLTAALLAAALATNVHADQPAPAPQATRELHAPFADRAAAWPLEVARPGWVRVGIEALSSYGLALRDPAGAQVPFAIVRRPERADQDTARVASVDPLPEGWLVVIDTGAVPVCHDALILPLGNHTATGKFAVDAGDGSGAWAHVTTASLFNLGAKWMTHAGQWQVDYPARTERYVRLHWPKAAGLPEFTDCLVQFARGCLETERVSVPPSVIVPLETPGGTSYVLDWAHGPEAVDGITLETPEGRSEWLGTRTAWKGTWLEMPLGLQRAGPREITDLTLESDEPLRPLRVDLPGATVRAAAARATRGWLFFEARGTGTYLLTRGAGPGTLDPHALPPGPFHEVPLGALRPVDPAPLPKSVTDLAPMDQLPRRWSSWHVLANDVKPGDIARVPLPPEMFAPGVAPEIVRPVAAMKIVPFALDVDPLPVRVTGDVKPVLLHRTADSSTWEIPLPEMSRELGNVELFPAQWGDFGAQVVARYRTIRRPGAPPVLTPASQAEWVCAGARAPSCNAVLPLEPPEGASALEITIERDRGSIARAPFAAAGNALPEPATAWLWARRRALVFAWPDAPGGVRVISGFDQLNDDAPQVKEVRANLLPRAARVLAVDLAGNAAESEKLVARSKIALVVSLVVTAAVLLFVLSRALRRRPA